MRDFLVLTDYVVPDQFTFRAGLLHHDVDIGGQISRVVDLLRQILDCVDSVTIICEGEVLL